MCIRDRGILFQPLTKLDKKIHEKRPGLQKKKIIFHQDNAPAHKSVLAMGKLRDLHYKFLEHPPYSPDLAHLDFLLFPKLEHFYHWSAFFVYIVCKQYSGVIGKCREGGLSRAVHIER